MDISVGCEGFYHVFIARHGCHHAQFDLRIVGREENLSLIRDDSLADFLSVLTVDRDILEVRIRAGEASRGGDTLIEGRMYVTRIRIDESWQRIYVSANEFLQTAMGKYLLHDRMLGAK